MSNDFFISKRAKDGHNYVEKKKEESGNITYIYDEKHVKARNKKKAERLKKLSKSLNKVRSQVKKDLTNEDERTRLAAIAVALIDETFERVGNRYSAADMKHYGATTWLVKHVKFSGSTATIKYVGKAGVKQKKVVKTPKVVSALKKLCQGKKPSDLVFETEDFTLTDNNVNQYLRPFDITAKDIRGLHANVEVAKQLKKMKKGKDEKERKAAFKEAVENAAEIVGHKASTLKNQYLVPGFEEKYIASGAIVGPKKASKDFPLSKRALTEEQLDAEYDEAQKREDERWNSMSDEEQQAEIDYWENMDKRMEEERKNKPKKKLSEISSDEIEFLAELDPEERRDWISANCLPEDKASATFPLSKRASIDFSIPIKEEQKNCPKVYLMRQWTSDDGLQAACKLLVCGKVVVWRYRNNKWARDPSLVY